jgi:hypothetical protein
MRGAQGAGQAAGQREAVAQEEPANRLQGLGGQIRPLGAVRFGQDMQVNVRFIQAAALKRAQPAALFCNATVVNDEPGNPGLERHKATHEYKSPTV